MARFLRGQVYWLDLGHAEKPWLVVSNNSRNRALGTALVARITTTPKPHLPSIVELGPVEPVTGSVLCDDIETIYGDDDCRLAGALSPAAMRRVDQALVVAFGLT